MKDFNTVKIGRPKFKYKNSVVIHGFPGIGNVAKIAVDFLISDMEAEPFLVTTSPYYSSFVYITKENLVYEPNITFYYLNQENKLKKNIILLSGNTQPPADYNMFFIASKLVNLIKFYGTDLLISLGGLGLPEEPKAPKVYCAGTNLELTKDTIQKLKINPAYNTVSLIAGLNGIMLSETKKKKIDSLVFVAETELTPFSIGSNAAKELVKVLSKLLELNINTKTLDKKFPEITTEQNIIPNKVASDTTNYIG